MKSLFKTKLHLKTINSFLNRKLAPIIRDITYFLYSHSKKNILFSICYSVQKKILLIKPIKPFDIINHRLYAEFQSTSSVHNLFSKRIGYSSNLVYNLENPDFSLMPLSLPNICLISHQDVRIQGNSDFIIDVKNNFAINDFSYNMDSKYENIDGILFCQKKNLALLRYDGKHYDRNLKAGIMLSGKFSENYYHQIYEIMIKLLVLDNSQISIEVPLIVDEIIFNIKSFQQIFESLNRTGRRIEMIGAKEMLKFENLFCISAVNIIPPNRKHLKDDLSYDIIFDTAIINQMRVNLLEVKSDRHFPKKVFISRKSSSNRRYNEDEVISLVKKFGFSVVAPEEYDFFDQIALFNSADFIIGASGAAFSNILFCHKECKIICFQPRRLNVAAFSTIAYTLGIDMRYCLGFPNSQAINTTYKVNLEMLEMMLHFSLS